MAARGNLPARNCYRLLVSIQAMEPDKGADPRVRGILWVALIVMGLAAVLILWFASQGILSALGNLGLLILIPASVLIGMVVRVVIYVWNLPIWIIFPMIALTLVYGSYQTINIPGPTPISWYVKTAILLIAVLLVLPQLAIAWMDALPVPAPAARSLRERHDEPESYRNASTYGEPEPDADPCQRLFELVEPIE